MTEPNHRFHRMLTEAQRFEDTYRKKVEEFYSYYDGDQWTEEEKFEIESRGQQPTVLNIISPTIDMLMALERSNASDIQVVGREGGDDDKARLLTALLKHVNQNCDFDFYNSAAFKDAMITGRGWIGTGIRRDESGKVQIFTEHIPFEEVYIDPYSRKPDGSDARYMIRVRFFDRDELKALYPAKAQEVDAVFNDSYHGQEYNAQSNSPDRPFEHGYYDHKSQRCMVCECYYTSVEAKMNKDGALLTQKRVRRVVFSDSVILSGSVENDSENKNYLGIDFFPWVPIWVSRSKDGLPNGVLNRLKDLQDQINKLNSKFMWSISSNRVVMESGATADVQETAQQAQRPDGVIVLENEGMSKFQLEQNTRDLSYIPGHVNFLLSMCQRISGVNDSMLGFGGVNERSGIIQQNRIAQGATMQTSMLDHLFFSKKQLSKIMLRLIGEWYTDERIVRVTAEFEKIDEIRFNEKDPNDPNNILTPIEDTIQYDVIFKKAPPYSSIRDRQMQLFTEVFKSGVIPPPIASKLMVMWAEDIPNKDQILSEIEGFYNQQAQQAQLEKLAELQQAGQPPPAIG